MTAEREFRDAGDHPGTLTCPVCDHTAVYSIHELAVQHGILECRFCGVCSRLPTTRTFSVRAADRTR